MSGARATNHDCDGAPTERRNWCLLLRAGLRRPPYDDSGGTQKRASHGEAGTLDGHHPFAVQPGDGYHTDRFVHVRIEGVFHGVDLSDRFAVEHLAQGADRGLDPRARCLGIGIGMRDHALQVVHDSEELAQQAAAFGLHQIDASSLVGSPKIVQICLSTQIPVPVLVRTTVGVGEFFFECLDNGLADRVGLGGATANRRRVFTVTIADWVRLGIGVVYVHVTRF